MDTSASEKLSHSIKKKIIFFINKKLLLIDDAISKEGKYSQKVISLGPLLVLLKIFDNFHLTIKV